jgi:hypothetical protein
MGYLFRHEPGTRTKPGLQSSYGLLRGTCVPARVHEQERVAPVGQRVSVAIHFNQFPDAIRHTP